MPENLLLVIAGVLITSTMCQWLAWRLKLPGIVFLLIAGIMAGPILGLLAPEKIMGAFFFPFVSLSVAIILFEGSLTLRFQEIRGLGTVVQKMVSIGMLVTWVITALAARYAVGLSWEISLLFGAIATVSGPTVIVPMLRTIRPTSSISNILRWEGIIIDPIGAGFAVLVYEFVISGTGQEALGHTLLTFGKMLLVGGAVGATCGYLFGIVIRNHWLPIFLHNLGALTLVIVSFIASNALQHESGLITVTILGIWLANMKNVEVQEILDFKENISILLISVLFIMLSARLDIQELIGLGWGVVFLFLAIQFLARPLNIMISSLGSKLTWPERHMLAWIAPRGIVAAAISALFAVQLEKAGVADANLLVPLTFFIIIVTVVLQSMTARPIALWLKVAEPDPRGFLIIGANSVARAVARALTDNKITVLLADTEWENVSKAKIDGLPAYFGNPISEHANRHIDLVGIGRVLTICPYENINAAAVMHFRMELGNENVFTMPKSQTNGLEGQRLSVQRQGSLLFGNELTYSLMASALSKNGEIRTTTLTEKFDFKTFLERHQQRGVVPLFALRPDGKIHVFSDNRQISPKPEWTIIYLLVQGDKVEEKIHEQITDGNSVRKISK
ncbi:cation:proton antiporter [Desulfosediminicola flagellatus]|uniref:cation:proton antiporter n=1 Tax=Desulfosediminicola flagellatus TaxID=2569541 RepID=UPI0010AC8B51|nr:sodium:proton antiporter [Desulfosediminicola flagellatus]